MRVLHVVSAVAVTVAVTVALGLTFAPQTAQAQSFYVTVVESEGTSSSATSAFETSLPGMARACVTRRSARRFSHGQRLVIVNLGSDGHPTSVEVRSDDVSPSTLETNFTRCLEASVRNHTFPRPETQPAIFELAFEYAAQVPSALAPGGTGVRRGPRTRPAAAARAQGTGLPPDRVRAFVQTRMPDIDRCLLETLTASATNELEMTVQADGRVEMVNVIRASSAPAFDTCLSNAVRAWVFPAPGARVAIRFPFSVHTDVAAPTPAPVPPTSAPVPTPAPAPAPAPAPTPRR